MRFIPAFVGALLITIVVFLFMQGLIDRGNEEIVQLVVHKGIEIFHPEPEQQQTEPEQNTAEEPPEEPLMETLELASPSPPTALPATELELPALDLGVGDIDIRAVGQAWSAPLDAGGVPVAGSGDAQGYVEVIPFNTRRPNVPKVAWQNKVNGWVLVAFSITAKGNTRDVRVLDANPKGVFEEKVIAAVEDWQYQLNFSGKAKGEIILTQKVEVQWRNYPQNIPNVD
ncbi:MAG: TonB family protein [Proteobacteria bacterium]|nr:TonB family protein [Pseudomonadota bacterium]